MISRRGSAQVQLGVLMVPVSPGASTESIQTLSPHLPHKSNRRKTHVMLNRRIRWSGYGDQSEGRTMFDTLRIPGRDFNGSALAMNEPSSGLCFLDNHNDVEIKSCVVGDRL